MNLLACPFCGELPAFRQHYIEFSQWTLFHRCPVIGIAMQLEWDKCRDTLTKRWNTRHQPAVLISLPPEQSGISAV
jgi:hypothetical protein